MRLIDVCDINPKAEGIDDNTEVSFVAMPDVSEDGKINAGIIRSYYEVKKGFTCFREGDVLFAKITPCMENGKGALAVGLKNGIGCGSTEFHVLRPNPQILQGKWLYYLTAWSIFRKNAERHMTGSAGQKRVPKSFLEYYELSVPKEIEQLNQINVLDRIRTIIDLRKREIQRLDELIKARFVEMFGDPVINTLGWKQVMLRNITSKIGSGATPRGGKESYQTEGVTLIRSMNVHDGLFVYKELAHITDGQAAQLDNVTVEENDVFINITGASVARSCVVPMDVLPARVNQHVAIIRCKHEELNPIFANNMFICDRFKRLLLDIGESGGATRQAITKQQLESLSVIVPPIALQMQFADFVKQVDKSKQAHEYSGKLAA